MKNSREYAAVLGKLLRRVRRELGAPVEPEKTDLITELALACLSQYASENKAQSALTKLRNHFVDFNELRVCRESEVSRILGTTYPKARDTANLLVRSLRAIFDRQDVLNLDVLNTMGKREAKTYLEEFEEIPHYVVARIMLRGLGGHAFPVNEKMLEVLRAEEAVDEKADEADVQGFMERQIAAKDMLKQYVLLREHADQFEAKRNRTKKRTVTKKKTATKKKTSTRKKATRKTTSKSKK